MLTEWQIAALERKREEQLECGEIETAHPGYLGSQDTFYVGDMRGVGRIYQQNFVDTHAKVAFAKLYTTKTTIAAADLLNGRVLPFFYQEHQVPLLRVLTDRGTECCSKVEQHDYQLYLAVNGIDHICERFHKTILNEFYQSPAARRSPRRSSRCRRILTHGSARTTVNAHIKEKCVVDERR